MVEYIDFLLSDPFPFIPWETSKGKNELDIVCLYREDRCTPQSNRMCVIITSAIASGKKN